MIEITTVDGITVMLNIKNVTSIVKGSEYTAISMTDSTIWHTNSPYDLVKQYVEKVLKNN